MDQLQDLGASLAATRESVDALSMQMLPNEGVESKLSDMQEMLAAILEATTEQTAQTASVGANASSVQDAILSQIVALREDIIRQNVNIQQNTNSIFFLLKQNAAILAAIQEHAKAIEKLAAPTREIGKRKRVEGTSADAANQQETNATDSQTSAADKLVSSSLKGKGPTDAGEGTSAAGGRKKMKALVQAPAMEVVSVNATGPHEATCMWTIPNFSKLKVDGYGGKYSDTFCIGGHEWRLCVFPRGYGPAKDKSVSLYLKLADDTNKLPKDGKVTADCYLSVICQHDRDKSRKGVDKNREFNAKGRDWGWPNFISLTDFHDAANWFLVNDTVVIEAKIEVNAPAKEVVSVNAASPLGGTYIWTIPNFSKLKVNKCGWKSSDVFSIGGHEWWLWVNPRWDWSGKTKTVSLFLVLADNANELRKDGNVTAAFSLSMICQHDRDKSHKKEVNHEFHVKAKAVSRGWPDFISLTDLRDDSRGFLVNDTVIIKAEIEVKKNMKASAPAPAKEVVSVNATGPHEGTCTWTIHNFSSLIVDEVGSKFSDTFSIGGHEWRLWVFPRGWLSGKDKSLCLYLVLADDTDEWPEDWKVTAAFSLSVICQHDPGKSHKKEVNHEFHAKAKAVSRGWPDFISLNDLHDPRRGFLVNDTVTFEAKIEVKMAPAPSDSQCTLSLNQCSGGIQRGNDDTTADTEREPEEGAGGNTESRRRGPEVTPESQSGATTAGESGKIELGTGQGVGGSGGDIATSVGTGDTGTGGDVVKTLCVFEPSLAL